MGIGNEKGRIRIRQKIEEIHSKDRSEEKKCVNVSIDHRKKQKNFDNKKSKILIVKYVGKCVRLHLEKKEMERRTRDENGQDTLDISTYRHSERTCV